MSNDVLEVELLSTLTFHDKHKTTNINTEHLLRHLFYFVRNIMSVEGNGHKDPRTNSLSNNVEQICLKITTNDIVKSSYKNNILQEVYDKAVADRDIITENMILYVIIEDLNKQVECLKNNSNNVSKNTNVEQSSLTTLQNKYQSLQQQYNKQSQTIGSLRKEIEVLRVNVNSHNVSPDVMMVEDLKSKIESLENELRPYRVQKIKLNESRKKNMQLDRLLKQIGF